VVVFFHFTFTACFVLVGNKGQLTKLRHTAERVPAAKEQ
jgi:hypothetical protein